MSEVDPLLAACEPITFYYPSENRTPELPEVGYVVSKHDADAYRVGDQVTVRHFTNPEERNAALAAAIFERKETR